MTTLTLPTELINDFEVLIDPNKTHFFFMTNKESRFSSVNYGLQFRTTAEILSFLPKLREFELKINEWWLKNGTEAEEDYDTIINTKNKDEY